MLRANVKRVGRLESEAGRSLNLASSSNAVRRLSSAVWSQARLLCGGCAMQSTAGNRSTPSPVQNGYDRGRRCIRLGDLMLSLS